jgi:hypothetical protein
MQLNVKFNAKFSGLLRAMRFSAMRYSAELRLRAMPHSTESKHIFEYLCEIESKFENILG